MNTTSELKPHGVGYITNFKTESNLIPNTLRRLIYTTIPVWAFDKDSIDIKKNTSVFHNDYMRLRISHIPILGVNNSNEIFQVFVNTNKDRIIKQDPVDRTDHPTKFSIHCKIKNTESHVINVTTDECDFYFNNEKITSPYKNPMLIVKLKYNQEFEFSAIGNMDIPVESVVWDCVQMCYSKETEKNNYQFYIEPTGQISAKQIISRAFVILDKKIQSFLDTFKKQMDKINKDDIESGGIIIIPNDEHTLSNLIGSYLKRHKDIAYAGYCQKHLLIKESEIKYRISHKSNKNILEILEESIAKLHKDLKSLNTFA